MINFYPATLACFVVLLLSACSTETSSTTESAIKSAPSADNPEFQHAVDDYLQAYWQSRPTSALYVGLYDYDNQLVVPNETNRTRRKELSSSTIAILENIDEASLSLGQRTDQLILLNNLRYGLWRSDQLQSWRWDPSIYNVAGGFGVILNTDYKPLAERLESFYQRMANIPAYYQAARDNILEPTREHLELAIQQNQGAIPLFAERFIEETKKIGLDAATLRLYEDRAALTVVTIEEHIAYLHNLKESLTHDEGSERFRSFRLGEPLFTEKFRLQIATDYSAADVYQLAIAKKQTLHDEMEIITKTLWQQYFNQTDMPEDRLQAIGMMITEVAKEHAEPENFVNEVRDQIANLKEFVIENNLLDLDPDKPLIVREMPEYQRGVAVASIQSPGPFDAKANTYYNVSPLDHYDADSAESFLREYNSRTLQILNIHEAIPGHYAQLIHSNKSKSLVKSLFGNGAMVEGWAVYAEHMMLEAGYGDGEPELRLMYNKWLLRTVINAIIDHDIHCNNMSEEQALTMMLKEGFQEQAEATGKWRRATLSQVQLSSYFTGYSEILAFREQLKAKQGNNFNLKGFHHQFLSYGSAPVPIIKQLMLEN